MPGRSRSPRHIDIVYEQDGILVANKPSGIPVHGGAKIKGGTLIDSLQARCKARVMPIHRLDQETSGLLLLTTDKDLAKILGKQLLKKKIERYYWAIVFGRAGKAGVLSGLDPERRPERLRFKRLVTFGGHSLLVVEPLTGRTHQIRRQFADAGFPVVGDRRYGDFAKNREFTERFQVRRLLLHAREMRFSMPDKKQPVSVCAEAPEDFQYVLERFGLFRQGRYTFRPSRPS